MPEGVRAYPRWEGHRSRGTRIHAIAKNDLLLMWRSTAGWMTIILALAYGILLLGQVSSLQDSRPDIHSFETWFEFLDILPWAGLAIAAVMASFGFVEDQRHGALELYMSRAIRPVEYVGGKALALFLGTVLIVAVPALIYWSGSYLLLDDHPSGWSRVPVGILAMSLFWSALVSGLALGLSTLSQGGRTAAILMFGSFFVLDVLASELLAAITENAKLQVLSPMEWMKAQLGWMFQSDLDPAFPLWWGLVAWAAFTVAGWALVFARRPRLAGDA